MVDSGIKLDQSVIEMGKEMENHEKNKYDYIMMVINDSNTKVVSYKVVNRGDCKKQYEDEGVDLEGVQPSYKSVYDTIAKEFPNKPAYFITYVDISKPGLATNPKLVFITWNPDSSPIKSKMVYSSTKDTITKKFKFNKVFNITDLDDLKFKEITKELAKTK